MLSPPRLLNQLEPQSSNAKLLLPIIPTGIVAYAFTLLRDSLCRNSCISNRRAVGLQFGVFSYGNHTKASSFFDYDAFHSNKNCENSNWQKLVRKFSAGFPLFVLI